MDVEPCFYAQEWHEPINPIPYCKMIIPIFNNMILFYKALWFINTFTGLISVHLNGFIR